MSKLLLGVNIDHIASIRQARGTDYPDLLRAAALVVSAGADSITVHLREDRRHIQGRDVIELKNNIRIPMNLELAITEEMLSFAEQIRPAYCCFVPERREELTTEGGLDVLGNAKLVSQACERMKNAGVQVSLFIDTEHEQIQAAAECGAGVIELHTGPYAVAADAETRKKKLNLIDSAAAEATQLGLQVNAGHGLHYDNVEAIAEIVNIYELNIGHSIVARAIFSGLQSAVSEMREIMTRARA